MGEITELKQSSLFNKILFRFLKEHNMFGYFINDSRYHSIPNTLLFTRFISCLNILPSCMFYLNPLRLPLFNNFINNSDINNKFNKILYNLLENDIISFLEENGILHTFARLIYSNRKKTIPLGKNELKNLPNNVQDKLIVKFYIKYASDNLISPFNLISSAFTVTYNNYAIWRYWNGINTNLAHLLWEKISK